MWEKFYDYSDIERYYTHCDAKNCLCPNGRTFSNPKWTLLNCSCCGSYGLHKLCRPENERENEIICEVCMKVVEASLHMNASHVDNVRANESQIISSSNQSENVQHSSNTNGDTSRMDVDLAVIDLTQEDDEMNVFEANVINDDDDVDDDDVSETLEEKRRRDKAARPARNELRDFRISFLFTDFKERFNKYYKYQQ